MFCNRCNRAQNNNIFNTFSSPNLNALFNNNFINNNYFQMNFANNNNNNNSSLNLSFDNKIKNNNNNLYYNNSYFNNNNNNKFQNYSPKNNKKSENYDKKKKKPFIEREGDWICIKCNNSNFAFRNNCNRCNLSKSDNQKFFKKFKSNN